MQQAPIEPTKGVLRIPRPPEGSKPVGMTPWKQTIYEREITEVVGKEPLKDDDGKTIYLKNPATGVPIKPKLRNIRQTRTQRFVIHVETNARGVATGDHTILEWTDERQRDAQQMGRRLQNQNYLEQIMSKAAEQGRTPEEVLERLFFEPGEIEDQIADSVESESGPGEVEGFEMDAEAEKAKADEDEEYPIYMPVGRWKLPDGSIVQGKKKDALREMAKLAGAPSG